MTFQPRPYQARSVRELFAYFERKSGHPLVVVPTGGGKSWIIADFLRQALGRYPATRVLVLSHVKEILDQDAGKLAALGVPHGVYCAGLGRRELSQPVTVASVQSVARRVRELGPIDLVLIDECHRVPHSGEGRYRALIDELREASPHLKVIGFSATPYRMKSGLLHRGEGRLFTDVAVDVTIKELLAGGYLAPLRSKGSHVQADLSTVKVRGGEFVPGELERAMNQGDLIEGALDETERHASDRRSWLVFCAGIAHAEAVAEALQARGIETRCVFGSTPAGERAETLEAFKAGELRALVNVDVLTTGFDAPDTDCLVMLRPTQSPGLYVQMLGRGMRIAPGKDDCLVLDFAGNVERHGCIEHVGQGLRQKGDKGEAPVRLCPECFEYGPTGARVCGVCGHEFPAPEKSDPHQASATTRAIMTADRKAETVPVSSVSYHRHVSRRSGNASVRVDYRCGLMVHKAYLCFGRGGRPGREAARWWVRNVDPLGESIPATVDDALELLELFEPAPPVAIKILPSPDGKWMHVVDEVHELEEAAE